MQTVAELLVSFLGAAAKKRVTKYENNCNCNVIQLLYSPRVAGSRLLLSFTCMLVVPRTPPRRACTLLEIAHISIAATRVHS